MWARNDVSEDGDTIAAIATPRGTGGISIVRISGPRALEICGRMVRLARGRKVESLKSWRMVLGEVRDPGSLEPIDQAIVLVMRAPRSYTGEDVVEIQCHGGSLVTEKILNLALALGARLAEPGEFTRRAFLNGRISLEEAEAVLDVVNSRSELSLAQATRRLRGELGAVVRNWESRLLGILACIQAGIDFPEDADPPTVEGMASQIRVLREEIRDMLSRAPLGLALVEGVEVALVGRPNVGKSSLFNALLSEERAIVTEIPGTTRDVLREHTEWYGLPVVLLDTAGLRQTSEIIEAIGVARARTAALSSEVILYVLDDSEGISPEDKEWLERWGERRLLAVISKVDLGKKKVSKEELGNFVGDRWVEVSSVTGQGIDELKRKVSGLFGGSVVSGEVVPGSARQVDCLRRAEMALSRALEEMGEDWTWDMVVLSLEEAERAFLELIGGKVTERTLDMIFSRFCVGK